MRFASPFPIRTTLFAALAVAAAPALSAAPAKSATLLDCLESIARTFHVRIVDKSGRAASLACSAPAQQRTLEQAMDQALQPQGLAWRRLDDGTLEIVAADHAPARVKLPPLDIEGDPVASRPDNPVATGMIERATATTTLDRRWLDGAPLLGFNQLSWYAPNVYGTGQSLAIRGTERDIDALQALSVTFDGIDLGTRLLDDELVPLDDVTNLKLARGPRAFESVDGAQAGAIALKTAAPAAEPTTTFALGLGNLGARNGEVAWSGPLPLSGLGATIAFDEHELPGFVHQVAVPQADVAKRHNDFGRIKLSYVPDASGFSAGLAAIALSGDTSDRAIVPADTGQPSVPFDPSAARDSYASNPIVADTRARGAAAFVRYEDPARWSVDAHASITSISRAAKEFPDDVGWTDRELRRRLGLTVSDHPAPDWTVVAGLEHSDLLALAYGVFIDDIVFPTVDIQTKTNSASLWVEHAWGSTWSAGVGVRWLSGKAMFHYDYNLPIPLAAVEWRPWANQQFSLSYGTGYRGGQRVYGAIPGGTPMVPERSRDLELAWRAQWFGDRLHSTVTAFETEVHDGFTAFASDSAGNLLFGRSRSRGLELELDAELSDYWRLRAGLGTLSSRYTSAVFRDGDPTSEAPPQTATVGVRYGLAQGWYGALDAYRAAAVSYDVIARHVGSLPAYDVLSARVGFRAERWETALTVTNAANTHFIERIEGNPTGYRLGDPRRIEWRTKWTW